MTTWQRLHFRFGLPQPPLEPLAVERLYLDNYFSIAKAKRDLGYEPLFTQRAGRARVPAVLHRAFRADEERGGGAARPLGHGRTGSGLSSPVALLTRAARSSLARKGNTSNTAATTAGS